MLGTVSWISTYIRKVSTYSMIVKAEHFEHDDPIETKDFEPLVVYSLNKKRRWEIDQDSLNLFSEEEEIEIMVFEREIWNLRNVWWNLNYVHYHVCVNHSKPLSSTQIEEAKKKEKVIGYHIVRAPKNYKKIFDNKCFRYLGLRYPEFLGFSTRELLTPLEYELRENEGPDDVEIDAEESETVAEIEKPSAFYNWSDHIVFKKPRRSRGWILI